MTKFLTCAKRFLNEEEGASMVEYGLMLGLIALVALSGAQVIGTKASSLFSIVGNTL
jgi:pilus assembly protein Flp/PilA